MPRNTLSARTFLAGLLTVSVATASAVEIYSPQGFESPLFTEGDLHLQDGWLAYNDVPISVEIVPSTHPSGGDQMVRMTTTDWATVAGAVKELNYVIEPNSVVSLSFDMRLDESWFIDVDQDGEYRAGVAIDFDSTAGIQGSFMAAAMFGDEDPGPYAGKKGYMFFDMSFVEAELDTDWHRIGLTYDNFTGKLVGTLDDVVLLTSYFEPGSVTEVMNIAFGSERYWGGPETAFADFDELSVTVAPSAVPEPSTVVALGLGALALMRRRRSSSEPIG